MKFILPKAHLDKVWRMPHPSATREGFELMDRNERTVDFPPEVMEQIRRLITPFILRAYPEPEALYEKLAAWLNLSREMLLITMGADGGVNAVFDVFVEPGDEVITVAPSYGMYPVYCAMSGAASQQVRFNDDLSLAMDQILDRISDKTKVVILANPNQPIERVYSEAEMVTILDACVEHSALLVMDEAYHHFCPVTAVPLLKSYGNLVVIRSFSKAFGISGLRVGYVISRPENIVHLNKVRPVYETSSVAIAVTLYLLEHDDLMTSYVTQVKEVVEHLSVALRRLGFEATGRWSNSILVTLPHDLSAQELAHALKQLGCLVRAESEPPLSNHLRITAGSRTQADRFLEAFETALQQRRVRSAI